MYNINLTPDIERPTFCIMSYPQLKALWLSYFSLESNTKHRKCYGCVCAISDGQQNMGNGIMGNGFFVEWISRMNVY